MIYQTSFQAASLLGQHAFSRPVVSGVCGKLARLPTDTGERDLVGPLRFHRSGHGHESQSISVGGEEADVLEAYHRQAQNLHEHLVHDRGLFVAELLGATGSGKTRLLEHLIDRAPGDERIGVVVGDVAGEDDATRLREHDVAVTTVNTGKECHLDPELVEGALADFDLAALDQLYLENVGNMVCPADFPLGAQVRVLVVSTTEGDDVVRKHPLLFQACDAAVVNKTDIADAVDADVDQMIGDVANVAPDLPTFRTSAKTGAGLDDLAEFLSERRRHGHTHTDHERGAVADAHTHDGVSDQGDAHDHAESHND